MIATDLDLGFVLLGNGRPVELLSSGGESILRLEQREKRPRVSNEWPPPKSSSSTHGPLLWVEDQTSEDLGSLKASLLSDTIDLLENGIDDFGIAGEGVQLVSVGVNSRDGLALEEVSEVGLV